MLEQVEARMRKSMHALKEELAGVRAGRANISLLDHVLVPYYGSDVPLNQVANLSVPEPKVIVIAPWERTMIPTIEKAIMRSDLGLTPNSDSEVVRLVLPELTEERRHELVKQIKKIAEQSKVSVRNIRRDANDQLKKQVKDKEMSEDESTGLQEKVQLLTDRFIADIDHTVEHKEQDILSI
ncbi:MAG: ribosome recycling factor [Mariprofundaceae bacterium]